MNEESLNKTIKEKKVCFFSRSRQKLWTKGETSGNYLNLREIKYDCDKDALLVLAKPQGPTCHTGEDSCFFRSLYQVEDTLGKNILFELEEVVNERYVNKPEDSYTTYLFNEGLDKILKKVGEEASEVIIASKNDATDELIYEISDLIYHLIVLMKERNVSLEDIFNSLKARR